MPGASILIAILQNILAIPALCFFTCVATPAHTSIWACGTQSHCSCLMFSIMFLYLYDIRAKGRIAHNLCVPRLLHLPTYLLSINIYACWYIADKNMTLACCYCVCVFINLRAYLKIIKVAPACCFFTCVAIVYMSLSQGHLY